MIFPRCAYCGNEVNPKIGFRHKENKKYIYFCDANEYRAWVEKNDRINEICEATLDALGEVTTETSWKYIKNMVDYLSQSYSFEQILNYIRADSARIYDILEAKGFDKNFERVRYYIGIVKNSIGDYIREQQKLAPRQSKEVDYYVGEDGNYKPTNFRRAMVDIEELEELEDPEDEQLGEGGEVG